MQDFLFTPSGKECDSRVFGGKSSVLTFNLKKYRKWVQILYLTKISNYLKIAYLLDPLLCQKSKVDNFETIYIWEILTTPAIFF